SLDCALHLPQLHAAVRAPGGRRHRGRVRGRGLAQLRRRLRPDATGLAGQRGGGLGAAAGALRRTLPAHVALLPRRFDGELPHPPHPAVAAADVAGRRAGRPRGPALSAVPRATSAAAGRRKALPPPERGKRMPRRSARQSARVPSAGGAPSSTAPSRPRLTSSGRMSGSLPEKSRNSCSASLLPPCESRVARKRSPLARVRPPFSSIQATVLASSTSDQM